MAQNNHKCEIHVGEYGLTENYHLCNKPAKYILILRKDVKVLIILLLKMKVYVRVVSSVKTVKIENLIQYGVIKDNFEYKRSNYDQNKRLLYRLR